jgi:hypothetical protein
MTPNPKRAYSAQPIPEPCVDCGDHQTPILREDGLCLQCSAWIDLGNSLRQFKALGAFEASKASDHA